MDNDKLVAVICDMNKHQLSWFSFADILCQGVYGASWFKECLPGAIDAFATAF